MPPFSFNMVLLHNCRNCNGCSTKQCPSFNPLMISFHNCSLMKDENEKNLKFFVIFWLLLVFLWRERLKIHNKSVLWRMRFRIHRYVELTSITLIKSFFRSFCFFLKKRTCIYAWNTVPARRAGRGRTCIPRGQSNRALSALYPQPDHHMGNVIPTLLTWFWIDQSQHSPHTLDQ